MSLSAAPRRRVSIRRPPFPVLALAVVGALALFAVLVAIGVSSTSSGTIGAIGETAGAAPAPPVVVSGYFRDPTTHALERPPGSTITESIPRARP